MRKWHPNEEKNVMKSKLIFLPFISGWCIHIQTNPSNTWTLLKLDGVQASRFSSHINRASLSDQNDGICTVIYLLPRLLQLEWEKKSPNKIRSHPKEKQSFLNLGLPREGSLKGMHFELLLFFLLRYCIESCF